MAVATKNRIEELNGENVSSVLASTAKILVEIEGVAPGLMFQGKGLMAIPTNKPRPPEEEARLRAHWTTVGGKAQLGIPWVMLYQSICKAGAAFKHKGKKKYDMVLAPRLACEQEVIPLGTDKFETHVEWVRIPPRTGAMVQIGRPVLRKWKARFVMVVDCDIFNPEVLRDIITEAGKNVGIGAWRPQLKGPWGRFGVGRFSIEG